MRISNFAAVTMLVLASTVGIVSAHAQTYSVLYNFGIEAGDPRQPQNSGNIAQGRGGGLFSTTPYGGSKNFGAVFRISSSGQLTTLFSFTNGANGGRPYGGLTLGTDGNFYGTTSQGGTRGAGTVFKITPTGSIATLYVFTNGSDGDGPWAPPIQATDGNFYGTVSKGGGTACSFGCGTIYKITPSGQFSILYQFDKTHGAVPYAPLLQGRDGKFYGTTNQGGSHGKGVVFRLTRTGKLTVLHNFSGVDGAAIWSPLVQGSDGSFYGTSALGGATNSGVVFKITPPHKFSVLHSMNGTTDGSGPIAGLIQATDGNFYGVDGAGGSMSNCNAPCGTLFRITPTGIFSVLYNFDGKTGANPSVAPFQHTNGFIYSDTNYGGTGNIPPCAPGACGVFYNVDIGVGPFVSFVGPQYPGKAGKTIQILGQGFTGTTAVSFNGTAASYIIKSDTFLTAIVPIGATTGFVTVTTRSGTLTSNKQFIVKP